VQVHDAEIEGEARAQAVGGLQGAPLAGLESLDATHARQVEAGGPGLLLALDALHEAGVVHGVGFDEDVATVVQAEESDAVVAEVRDEVVRDRDVSEVAAAEDSPVEDESGVPAGARQVALSAPADGLVVTLFPDSGERYLSKLNREWMQEQGLLENGDEA